MGEGKFTKRVTKKYSQFLGYQRRINILRDFSNTVCSERIEPMNLRRSIFPGNQQNKLTIEKRYDETFGKSR